MKKNIDIAKKKKLVAVSCRMCGAGSQLYFLVESDFGEKIFRPCEDIRRALHVTDVNGECPKCGSDSLKKE